MASPFDLFINIQKLIIIALFALTVDNFQFAFKDIFSRAISSDVLVHFIHKSSSRTVIQLGILDNFYKMNCFLLTVYSFYIPSRVFILLGKYFFFILAYLSSIHKKAMYRYVLDGKFALAWELLFPGHLSST